MKRILIGMFLCFSALANAESLECGSNYSLFEELVQMKSDANLISNESEILNFIEKYDYSSLFNEKHPNKKFWGFKNYDADRQYWAEDEWIDSKVYNKRIGKLAKYNAKNELNPYFYELLDYKYNAVTPVGEVCIIPVQAYARIESEGEELGIEAMLVDYFFVRDNLSDQWRVLDYGFQFLDQDLKEFFPGLPVNIKNGLNTGVIAAEDLINVSIDDQ
ncbi:MAG: hypothetical protein RR939_09270 [Acinetobacter sp.]